MTSLAIMALKNIGESLKPRLVNGKWYRPLISARVASKLRKEALIAGDPWPHDPIPKDRVYKPPKGPKHERERPERQARIAKLMSEMPQRIAEYRESLKKKPPAKKKKDVKGNQAELARKGSPKKGRPSLDAKAKSKGSAR
eukprot:CAMPEP_0184674392 /NCGR_PEP_ID=MMETSP0308-20130426/87210_1 /TAXON_ID=38269 /ORGANISM="Gloeochaete witrockiana, Strain SAG 46.84" /LENGTH=140 /DNA_ID=CAMNT_0027121985 /DNA_START=673 /DNA_END=1095 /DNA_ORIENTATION=-